MAKITYVLSDGTERSVDVPEGTTLMLAAIQNNIRGIDAECGGCLSCATCHVYVDPAHLDRLPPVSGDEDELLNGVASDRKPESRLSCQITVSAALEGLVVRVPPRQS